MSTTTRCKRSPKALGMHRVEVEEMVSFYAFFDRKPKGRNRIRLSKTPISFMKGAQAVAQAFETRPRRQRWRNLGGRRVHPAMDERHRPGGSGASGPGERRGADRADARGRAPDRRRFASRPERTAFCPPTRHIRTRSKTAAEVLHRAIESRTIRAAACPALPRQGRGARGGAEAGRPKP